MATWLKTLLQQMHLQNHDLFIAEYEKVASDLGQVDGGPSRAQFHRWLRGEVQSLPQPRHCRVLETMFPQWTVAELFTEPNGDLAAFKAGTAAAPAATADSSVLRARAELAGTIVDLSTDINIEIDADGHVRVGYTYKVLNLTDKPVIRIPRAIWFKHVHNELLIEPTQHEPHQTFIQHSHEAGGNHAKFAYNFSPPIPPNGTAVYGCECTGGQFVDAFYWRHSVQKGTEQLTISVLHRSRQLKSAKATEELTDGTELLINDKLQWQQTDEGISLHLEHGNLDPTQSVTVTWEVSD